MNAFEGGEGDPVAAQNRERFPHLPRQQLSPATVPKLLKEGKVRQCIERIVEIDEELAPEHSIDVGAFSDLGARYAEDVGEALNTCTDLDRACGGAVKAGRLTLGVGLDHVERHHGGDDAVRPTEGGAERIHIIDAVLHADDDGKLRRMLGDEVRHVFRVAALDRDEDQLRRGQGRRGVCRKVEAIGRDDGVTVVQRGDAQPAFRDKGGQPPARSEA